VVGGEVRRCEEDDRSRLGNDLAERLPAIGVNDTEKNVVNKIARGGFTTVFFLQCMEAIGVQNIHLNGD
jgi:hypothetical protein